MTETGIEFKLEIIKNYIEAAKDINIDHEVEIYLDKALKIIDGE